MRSIFDINDKNPLYIGDPIFVHFIIKKITEEGVYICADNPNGQKKNFNELGAINYILLDKNLFSKLGKKFIIDDSSLINTLFLEGFEEENDYEGLCVKGKTVHTLNNNVNLKIIKLKNLNLEFKYFDDSVRGEYIPHIIFENCNLKIEYFDYSVDSCKFINGNYEIDNLEIEECPRNIESIRNFTKHLMNGHYNTLQNFNPTKELGIGDIKCKKITINTSQFNDGIRQYLVLNNGNHTSYDSEIGITGWNFTMTNKFLEHINY